MAVTRRNAQAGGVADRVELHTADMTQLPFPDDSFDIVTSALAVHNIPTASGRRRALDAAIRVLRPGGRLLMATGTMRPANTRPTWAPERTADR